MSSCLIEYPIFHKQFSGCRDTITFLVHGFHIQLMQIFKINVNKIQYNTTLERCAIYLLVEDNFIEVIVFISDSIDNNKSSRGKKINHKNNT